MQRADDPVQAEIDALEARLGRLRATLEEQEHVPRGGRPVEILACTVGEHAAAFSLSLVEEIVLAPRLDPLPDTPYWVRGVLTLRGARLPVLDVLARVSGHARAVELSDAIVVVKFAGRRLGLMVQDVAGVERVPLAESTGTELDPSLSRFVMALMTVQDRPGVLFSVARLVANTEGLGE